MSEKRNHPRLSIDLFAFFEFTNKSGQMREATILNVSIGGAGFYTNLEIPDKTDIRLNIELPEKQNIWLNAKTMWCVQIADTGRYKVGVAITDSKGDDYNKFLIFCNTYITQNLEIT